MHKRRLYIAAILALLVVIGMTFSAGAAVCSDLDGHWAKPQIEKWISNGLASGYPDGTFRPDNIVSRAEFVTFVNKAFNKTDDGTQMLFTDVNDSDWFYRQVAIAQKAGYISGYPDGSFGPEKPITREEAAVIISKVLGSTGNDQEIINQFNDAQIISSWSRNSVAALVGKQIMSGFPDGSFKPEKPITRAEAVVTLDNTLNALDDVNSTNSSDSTSNTSSTNYTGGTSNSSHNGRNDSHFRAEKISITGTAYDTEDNLLTNKVLTFSSGDEEFTAVTDDNGYFATHITTRKIYEVTGDELSVRITSDGTLGGIQTVADLGRIVLGKTLSSGDNVVVFQPGTIYLDEHLGIQINYDPDSSTVTFDQIMDFDQGDIIILPPTAEYPGGLAVKVVEVEISGGTTTLTITEPELKEIVASIKGSTSTGLGSGSFTPAPGVEIESIQEPAQLQSLSQHQTAAVDDALNLKLTLGRPNEWQFEGTLELKGDLSGDIDWAWELDLVDSFDFRLDAQQSFIGDFQYLKTTPDEIRAFIGEYHIPTQIPGVFMDVPVYLAISPEGKFRVELKVTASETIGIRYDDYSGMRLYPEDKFQLDISPPVLSLAGEIKVGPEVNWLIAVAGKDIAGVATQAGGFLEANAESSALLVIINYGAYVQANVTVPLVDWVSGAIEEKVTMGTIELGNMDIKNFRITPTYLEVAAGDVKTFTLQVQNSNDDWAYLSENQNNALEFESRSAWITYLGNGEISVAPNAQDATVTVKFTLGEFTRYATVKITGALTEQGIVQGVVKDAVTNNPLAEASITVFNDDLGVTLSTATSDTGQFNLRVPIGDGYTAIIEKAGYLSEIYESIIINANETTYLEPILQIDENHSGTGTVSGSIVNALDGSGVEGLTINLRRGINVRSGDIITSVETVEDGAYSIADLEAGNYTGEITGTGFNTGYFTIICLGGMERPNQDAVVTPSLLEGDIRIVLTWGESPSDLDSHLDGPAEDGSRFHIYYSDKVYLDYANLDLDDISSYGPETTTITQQSDGVYVFAVHDFTNRGSSDSTALADSNATVNVYIGNLLVRSFHVPSDQDGTLWTVFELDGDSITSINSISYDSPYEIGSAYDIQSEYELQSQEVFVTEK